MADEKLTFEEVSRLNERKMQLKVAHTRYIESHPELKTMLTDFTCALLLEKPDDIYEFSLKYFSVFQADESGDEFGAKLKPVVIAGPSGVGKGTLISRLLKDFPDAFGFSVSHTTRDPRPGEINGMAYHFSTRDEMQAEIDMGKFVEHAEVHGNLYGTSVVAVNQVRKEGKICVLDIDTQGVQKVKATQLNCQFLFVRPPSMEALEARLRGRGTETEDKLALRLANATTELEYADEDGGSNFDFQVVNDDLEEAYTALKNQMFEWYPHLANSATAN